MGLEPTCAKFLFQSGVDVVRRRHQPHTCLIFMMFPGHGLQATDFRIEASTRDAAECRPDVWENIVHQSTNFTWREVGTLYQESIPKKNATCITNTSDIFTNASVLSVIKRPKFYLSTMLTGRVSLFEYAIYSLGDAHCKQSASWKG